MRAFIQGLLLAGAVSYFLAAVPIGAQQQRVEAALDSDHDGISDALEQQLLNQFTPMFMVSEHDCSVRPAEFKPEVQMPEVLADNGTIYGQVFAAKNATEHSMVVEIHYYHLWRKDCGGHGHPLDTEHVAVLARASDTALATARWKAIYWYAAAHEDTVCDVSQIARASTLHAEDHGATVWISPGKHASFLNGALCEKGCGADRCESMVPLRSTAPVNLGEPGHPMNGSLFIASGDWPLMAKMSASNFPMASIQRLNQLPDTDIAWFNPGRHPAQGVIARSATTEQAVAGGERNTTTAISIAGNATEDAVSVAGSSAGGAVSAANESTGNALQKSYRHTRQALGSSARHVTKALHTAPEKTDSDPH